MVRAFFDQHLPDDVKKAISLDAIKATKETFIKEVLRSILNKYANKAR
jgi:hypothetical protein